MKTTHFPVPTILIEYKDFLASIFHKLPRFSGLGLFLFGIFAMGFLFGAFITSAGQEYEDNEQRLIRENNDLRTLIDDYEELSDLYYLQGQNVGIVLDPEVYETNPDQSYEAVVALKQFREMIIDKQREIEETKEGIETLYE